MAPLLPAVGGPSSVRLCACAFMCNPRTTVFFCGIVRRSATTDAVPTFRGAMTDRKSKRRGIYIISSSPQEPTWVSVDDDGRAPILEARRLGSSCTRLLVCRIPSVEVAACARREGSQFKGLVWRPSDFLQPSIVARPRWAHLRQLVLDGDARRQAATCDTSHCLFNAIRSVAGGRSPTCVPIENQHAG